MSRKPVLIACGILLSGRLLFFFSQHATQQTAKEAPMSGGQTRAEPPSGPRGQLLHAMVNARDEHELSEALKQHGPVEADEVPYLVRETSTLFERRRRNAARALVLARGDAAQSAMRQVLHDTKDLGVWAVVLGSLLDQDGGKALAEQRPELVQKALHNDDPEILAVGLKAALRAGLPQALEEVRRRLSHPNDEVRVAAAEALGQLGASIPSELLRSQLAVERNLIVRQSLIKALCASDDPENVPALRRVLESTDRYERSDFWNGTKGCKKPWLRVLLWDATQQPGPSRGDAIERLAEWPADRAVVRLCLSLLEQPAPDELRQGAEHLAAQDGCATYLSKLAGRSLTTYAKPEAISFANQWLAEHPD